MVNHWWLLIAWVVSMLVKSFAVWSNLFSLKDLGLAMCLSTATILALAGTCAFGLPKKLGLGGLWLTNFLFSIICVIDVAYWQLLGDLPSASQLVTFDQLPDFAHEIPSTFGISALLFFGDLFLAPLLARWDISWPTSRFVYFSPLLISGAVVSTIIWSKDISPLSEMQLRRVSNRRQLLKMGTLGYHLYDLAYLSLKRGHDYHRLPDEQIDDLLQSSADSISQKYPGFGTQEGRNILVVVLESFSSFTMDLEVDEQEVTPFLNQLKEKSFWGHGEDQAAHGVSSDARFIILNSLHPPSLGPVVYHFGGNEFRALPHILRDRGFHTLKAYPYRPDFWNEAKMGPAFGFQKSYYEDDFTIPKGGKIGWGASDGEFFQELVPKLKNNATPFFCMAITVMMHHPFAALPADKKSLRLPPHLEGTMMGRYLHLARLRDSHLKELFQRLESEGLLQNLVVVLVGDHRTRMPAREFDLLSKPRNRYNDDRVLVLFACPDGVPSQELPRGIGLIDVGPTLLHLLGLDDTENAFLGKNLLSDQKSVVTRLGMVVDSKRSQTIGTGSAFSLKDARPMKSSPALNLQGKNELELADTLLFGNRIGEFVKRRKGAKKK